MIWYFLIGTNLGFFAAEKSFFGHLQFFLFATKWLLYLANLNFETTCFFATGSFLDYFGPSLVVVANLNLKCFLTASH